MDNAKFIGLMSGTSLDAVDLVLVDFNSFPPKLIATYAKKIPPTLKETLLRLNLNDNITLKELGELDSALGLFFADCINDFLIQINYKTSDIVAIGSHGQTIAHHPNAVFPFSMQIGDPNIIAKRTKITTVGDLRRADIAILGQGAPLVPLFHHYLFSSPDENRIILNLGGIANITFLPQNSTSASLGFDTGPANSLIDAWIKHNLNQDFDQDGAFAKSGTVNDALLDIFLSDPYFKQSAPKSTGKDHFNLTWIMKHLDLLKKTSHKHLTMSIEDIQATLTMLTATTVAQEVNKLMHVGSLVLCGGGALNKSLVAFLQQQLPKTIKVISTDDLNINPQWIEAMCFAWLAMQRINNIALDYTKITGAIKPTILGAIYAP